MLKGKEAIFDWEVFPEWNCKVWAEYDGNGGYIQMNVITPDTNEDIEKINNLLINSHCEGYIDLTYSDLDPDSRYIKQLRDVRNNYDHIGYNIIQYDLQIDDAACKGYTPKDLYKLNNEIINEDRHSFGYWRSYTFTDLISDIKMGSLKQYESNTGMNIQETTVPFGKKDLTLQEKAEIIIYCCHDVKATCKLRKDRDGYIKSKLACSRISSVTEDECLRNTSAKLAAKVMMAKQKTSTSETVYRFPKRLESVIRQHIHPTIIEEFDGCEIRNDWSYECKYMKNSIIFGTGGIHSTYKDALMCKSNEQYVIFNADFENLYPGLMTEFSYWPEGVPDNGRKLFKNILDRCRSLKQELKTIEKGTPEYQSLYAERDAQKLILNAATGAMRSKFSPLYDPTQIIKLCMTGQILCLLVAKCLHEEGALILQMNTDGVMGYIERTKLERLKEVLGHIATLSNIPIDLDLVNSVFQKDVNNYILIDDKGKQKLKGRWAKKSGNEQPLTPLNAPIVNEAVIEYYTNDIPIAKSIHNCTDMLKFCFTTMKGPTYDGVVYEYNGAESTTLNINRCYATTDTKAGTLYKIKYAEDGPDYVKHDKIASIPEHACLLNDQITTIAADLDYQWYIDKANKQLEELEVVNHV